MARSHSLRVLSQDPRIQVLNINPNNFNSKFQCLDRYILASKIRNQICKYMRIHSAKYRTKTANNLFFCSQDSNRSEKEPQNFLISEWSHQVSAHRKNNLLKKCFMTCIRIRSLSIRKNLNFLFSIDLIKLEWGFVFPRIPPPTHKYFS